MTNNESSIQVSVCIVTYNHEKYIKECLDSLVNQKTNFKFEIIIGEDCSTDSTRAIVQQYVEKYPELIVPIFHAQNVGVYENTIQVYKKAKGKYIAHMDGDDMALPNKLQKQFEALENNPHAMICSHNMAGILTNNVINESYWHHPKGTYTLVDLVEKLPFFAHSSKLFRVSDAIDLTAILHREYALDIELHLGQASIGSIIHLEAVLGRYRTAVGMSAIKDDKLNYKMIEKVMSVYEGLLISNPELSKRITKAYAAYLLGTANSFAVIESDTSKMRVFVVRSIKQKLFSNKQVIMLLLASFPSLGIPLLKKRHQFRSKQ